MLSGFRARLIKNFLLGHRHDEFFAVKSLQMTSRKDKETGAKQIISKTGVVCCDVDGLVKKCLDKIAYNPHETTCLIGLDDGQGILKVCTTIQPNKDDEDSEFQLPLLVIGPVIFILKIVTMDFQEFVP